MSEQEEEEEEGGGVLVSPEMERSGGRRGEGADSRSKINGRGPPGGSPGGARAIKAQSVPQRTC